MNRAALAIACALTAATPLLNGCDDGPGDAITITWHLSNASAFDPPITAVRVVALLGVDVLEEVVVPDGAGDRLTVSVALPCEPGAEGISVVAAIFERADGGPQPIEPDAAVDEIVRCGDHLEFEQRLIAGALPALTVDLQVFSGDADALLDVRYTAASGAVLLDDVGKRIAFDGEAAREVLALPCDPPDGALDVSLTGLEADGVPLRLVSPPTLTTQLSCGSLGEQRFGVGLAPAAWASADPADGFLAYDRRCRPDARCDADGELLLSLDCQREPERAAGPVAIIPDDVSVSCRTTDGVTTSAALPAMSDAGDARPEALSAAKGQRYDAATDRIVWDYWLALDATRGSRCTVIARAALADLRLLFDEASFLTPTVEWRLSLSAGEGGCRPATLADPQRMSLTYRGDEIRGWSDLR